MGELGCLRNDIWASWGVYGMTFGLVLGVNRMTFGRVGVSTE